MEKLELADLLTIWPIAKAFAVYTPAGDLINLCRTNSSLRSSLHGCIPSDRSHGLTQNSRDQSALVPEIGKHQTSHWAHLKAVSPFVCSSSTHVRGQIIKPCVYCSKPICDACIVRDAFKHHNEHTFKNRLRHYCADCWSEGRPCRSFRYPPAKVDTDGIPLETPKYIETDEDNHADLNTRCDCNVRDNGWLCVECKDQQNSDVLAPLRLSSNQEPLTREIRCYGLGCKNIIDLNMPDKDRRRICLWCEKPARRQFSSEDRMVWNLKTIEARARNAESRSRDLEEYNRRRFKAMRMSRRELRGSSGLADDEPMFVRHLDTINYRNWMTETQVPTPEAVWKSKNGCWRYHRGFLLGVQKRCKYTSFTQINNVDVSEMSRLTREGSSEFARLNSAWNIDYQHQHHQSHRFPQIPIAGHSKRNKVYFNELKARMLDLHLVHGETAKEIRDTLQEEYGVSAKAHEVKYQLDKWKQDIRLLSMLDTNGISVDTGASTAAATVKEAATSPAVEEPGGSHHHHHDSTMTMTMVESRSVDPDALTLVDAETATLVDADAITLADAPSLRQIDSVETNGDDENTTSPDDGGSSQLPPPIMTLTHGPGAAADDPPPYMP